MKNIVILFTLLLFQSCVKTKKSPNLKTEIIFDKIEHYQIEKNGEIENAVFSNKKRTKEEQTLFEIVNLNFPTTLNETSFINIIQTNFKGQIIDKKKHAQISNAFLNNVIIETASIVSNTTFCEPIYRDILIFKEHGKITGIVKVCFDCSICYFVNSKKSVEYRQTFVNYSNLQKILLN